MLWIRTWRSWTGSSLCFLAISVLGGLIQGFFRSVPASLGGLVLGLAVAAWNYHRAAKLLEPVLGSRSIANAIGFVLIALIVMAIFGIIGSLLARTFKRLGIGLLDRLAGALFGFIQGAILVTLGILVMVAFLPPAPWLVQAKLPRLFFGVCHLSTHVSPGELAQRVREGLRLLEEDTPRWLHPHES